MRRYLVVIIIVLGVLFRIWASQPTWIHLDENYYINIFQNFVDRGELTPHMWRLGGHPNIIAGGGSGYGIMVMIGWLSIFGETLVSIRMLMILAGLATAGLYYLIAKRWWNSKEAGIAAMLFGIVSTSSIYTLVGRMDALGILAYSLLLLLFISSLQQDKNWMHFLVGVVAILTVEFQTLGLLYVGALAFYYGIQYFQVLVKEKRVILNSPAIYYFAGAGLFGVLYFIMHIYPDPYAYFLIPSNCFICEKNVFISLATLSYRILRQRPIEFTILVILLYTEIRNKRIGQPFFIIFFGYFLTHLIIKPPYAVQYYYPAIPLIAIGIGGFSARILEKENQNRRGLLKNIFLASALILLVVHFINFQNEKFPYDNAYLIPDTPEITYIKENIPVSAVIMSQAENFYAMREYRDFLDARGQIIYGLVLRGEYLDALLEREKPIAVHMDEEYLHDNQLLVNYVVDEGMIQVLPKLWVAPEYHVEP